MFFLSKNRKILDTGCIDNNTYLDTIEIIQSISSTSKVIFTNEQFRLAATERKTSLNIHKYFDLDRRKYLIDFMYNLSIGR